MNVATLKSLAKARGLSQADLARLTGVSRQAVSNWFSQKSAKSPVNLIFKNMARVARALHVSVEELARPLPVLDSPEESKRLEASLLWDRLYPDLVSFSVGLVRGQAPALARLVQVVGLYEASKVVGKQVWVRFPRYESLIHPAYRSQRRTVWKTHQNQD